MLAALHTSPPPQQDGTPPVGGGGGVAVLRYSDLFAAAVAAGALYHIT